MSMSYTLRRPRGIYHLKHYWMMNILALVPFFPKCGFTEEQAGTHPFTGISRVSFASGYVQAYFFWMFPQLKLPLCHSLLYNVSHAKDVSPLTQSWLKRRWHVPRAGTKKYITSWSQIFQAVNSTDYWHLRKKTDPWKLIPIVRQLGMTFKIVMLSLS